MTNYPQEHMEVFGLLSGNEILYLNRTRQVLFLTCAVCSEEGEGGRDKSHFQLSFPLSRAEPLLYSYQGFHLEVQASIAPSWEGLERSGCVADCPLLWVPR